MARNTRHWGALRYQLCLVCGPWRDDGPILECIYIAGQDDAGDLAVAYGPLDKDMYLDGDLLAEEILLVERRARDGRRVGGLAALEVRLEALGGWHTLRTLLREGQRWYPLACYRLDLEGCALHLSEEAPTEGRPARIAPARLALARGASAPRIRAGAAAG